jgi:hypothetical protein
MASITPNMGLTKWDLSSDPYDHTQLAANFSAIDLHDHSTGKGVKIGSGGIANNAIITALIASGAVTTNQILDGTITLADISNALWDAIQPIGSVLYLWLPSGASYDLETNSGGRWVLARGQTLTTAQHDFDLAYGINTSIIITDCRNRYPLGADVAGTGSGVATPPSIGLLVGGHSINLNHTHTGNSHTHTIASHTHTVAHSHNVLAHTHPISADGPNKFIDDLGNPQALSTRTGATSGGSTFQSLYIPGATDQGAGTRGLFAGTHTHGGATGNGTGSTDVQTPSTSSVSQTTDAASSSTGTPSPDLSTTDNRPGSVGLVTYIKVKY